MPKLPLVHSQLDRYIYFSLLAGDPDALDLIVFVLLVVFVCLAVIAVVVSCVIVFLNKRKLRRRGTIATEVGDSVDQGTTSL